MEHITTQSSKPSSANDCPPAIEVIGFGKTYDRFIAVHDLSFELNPGEIMGLVGANGAGKTTTLRAIAGILRPTIGRVRIGGHDVETQPLAARQLLAYIPDTAHPYDLLTVTEHLHFIALAYRIDGAEAKYDALLEELGKKGIPVSDDNAVLYAMFPRETEALYNKKPAAPAPISAPVALAPSPLPIPARASAPATTHGNGYQRLNHFFITVNAQRFDVSVEEVA